MQQQVAGPLVLRVLSYNTLLSGELSRCVNCFGCVAEPLSVDRIAHRALVDPLTGRATADLVMMQEVGSHPAWEQLARAVRSWYPHQVNRGTLGALATPSHPFDSEPFYIFPETLSFYRFGTMVLHLREQPVSALLVHSTAETIGWHDRGSDLRVVRARLDELRKRVPSRAVVMAGDFNVNANHPEEYESMLQILGVPRDQSPQQPIVPSFWTGAMSRPPGTRLDYVWVMPPLDGSMRVRKVREVVMEEVKASDHRPVLAYLEIAPSRTRAADPISSSA